MTPAGRPDAVRRFARRPLWWALLAVAALGWILLDDTVTSQRTDQALDAGPSTVAEVEEVAPGGGTVQVTFVHPDSGASIRTVAELWSFDPAPRPGDEVEIDIAVDDPTRVALAGDRRRPIASLGFAAGIAAVPIAFLVGRAVGLRRSERLMAAGGPSFSMLGALRSSGRLRPHVVLDLYPLDAPVAGSPLCSLPVLHTGGLPLGRTHAVEVKGTPRPLGRVVARAGDGTVLWPRGRASWRTWSAVEGSRPHAGTSPAPVMFEQLDRPKWTNLWSGFPPALAIAVAGALAFGLLVSALTSVNRTIAAGADRSDILVLGTVVDRNPGFAEITVRYRPPDAGDDPEEVDAVLVVDDDDLHPVDSTVALRIDPDDPANIRLASEPYNAVVPLVWGWMPMFFTGVTAVSWLSVARRNRGAADGGWRRMASWRLTATDLIAVGFPDVSTASCVVRVPEGVAGRWPMDVHGWRDVLVAGSTAPGDPAALRIGDWAVPGVWVAEAPPGSASVERPGGAASRFAA